ncbi:MAG: alpha-L-fucosidase [Candidatus Hydrogenedentes bacterium]|nr:alpha-L-fucosidase [Candidatus Hydrogenedentota bacterium]
MKSYRALALGILSVFAFGSITPARAAEGVRGETKEQRDARMAWWREAKFGLFIHWGLYAVPGGVWNGKDVDTAGEWIMFGAKIPVPDYEPLLKEFNPVKFNADEWVRIAKDAGMKYIVITSKHHDGFALFDSKVSDYDVMATPFKRDIMNELSQACQASGLKMCWYHSILDWHHPDYLPRGEGSPRPWDTRPKEGASYDRYIEYMKGQLRELLTNYGPIGVLWFDGGWEHKPEEHHAEEVVAMIRSLQPEIIINNRIQIPQDFDTPEQFIPGTGIPDRDWETCMTMNDTWGFKVHDLNWKSTETLIRNLVDIVSKGGNFLLNVGPTAEGLIPEASVERLAAMGQWMKLNGESIYGSSASPFRRLAWGRCTVKPGKLYLHVFDWPADSKLVVPGLQNDVKNAYLLADAAHAALKSSRADDGVVVQVPTQAPNPIASVVVLEIAGKPDVVTAPLKPSPDGVLELNASDADLHGETLRIEGNRRGENIGHWANPKDWVSWDIAPDQAGTYAVELNYACNNGAGGSEFTVTLGDQSLSGKVNETGTWRDYKTEAIGTLKVTQPGRFELSIKPVAMPAGAVMNLRAVVLRHEAR